MVISQEVLEVLNLLQRSITLRAKYWCESYYFKSRQSIQINVLTFAYVRKVENINCEMLDVHLKDLLGRIKY